MFYNSFGLDKAVLLDGTTRMTCKGKSIKQLVRLGTFSEYIVVPELLVVKVSARTTQPVQDLTWFKKTLQPNPAGLRTPLNLDNGHLFHAQSTDSHRKSTSLIWTLHYQVCAVIDLPFLKVIKTFSWQHVHVRSATEHWMIRRRQFQTTLAQCIKQVMQRTVLIKKCSNRRAMFLVFSWIWSAEWRVCEG